METKYWAQVDQFNAMYRLPRPERPEPFSDQRLLFFKDILLEEVAEVDEIFSLTDPRARLVALADWLGDLIVYCSTEGRRHGLPMAEILAIIMDSNFSKLGPDGQPMYDARGKVVKGPHYWGPEPKIDRLLEEAVPPEYHEIFSDNIEDILA